MDVDPGQAPRAEAPHAEARAGGSRPTGAARLARRPGVWAWVFAVVFVASLALAWQRAQDRFARAESHAAELQRDVDEVLAEVAEAFRRAQAPYLLALVDPVAWEEGVFDDVGDVSAAGGPDPAWLHQDDGLVEDQGFRRFHAVALGLHGDPRLALLRAHDAASKELLGALAAHVDATIAGFLQQNTDLYAALTARDLVHHAVSVRRDVLRDVVVQSVRSDPQVERWEDPASGMVYVRVSLDLETVLDLLLDRMLDAFGDRPGFDALPGGRPELVRRLQVLQRAARKNPLESLQAVARRVGALAPR